MVDNGWDMDVFIELIGTTKAEEIVAKLGAYKEGADILIWKPVVERIYFEECMGDHEC